MQVIRVYYICMLQYVITVRDSPHEEASSERSDVNWLEFSKNQLAT